MVYSFKHCGNCANAIKALNGCYETPDECKSCVEDQFEVPSNWMPRESEDAKETAPLTLADSGNRREFSTGAVRDIQEGKGRCDLLPMDALYQISGADPFWPHIDEFQKSGDIFFLNRAFELLASKYCTSADRVVAQADYLLAQAVHMERGAKKVRRAKLGEGNPDPVVY